MEKSRRLELITMIASVLAGALVFSSTFLDVAAGSSKLFNFLDHTSVKFIVAMLLGVITSVSLWLKKRD
jgi:hypothetical protein